MKLNQLESLKAVFFFSNLLSFIPSEKLQKHIQTKVDIGIYFRISGSSSLSDQLLQLVDHEVRQEEGNLHAWFLPSLPTEEPLCMSWFYQDGFLIVSFLHSADPHSLRTAWWLLTLQFYNNENGSCCLLFMVYCMTSTRLHTVSLYSQGISVLGRNWGMVSTIGISRFLCPWTQIRTATHIDSRRKRMGLLRG